MLLADDPSTTTPRAKNPPTSGEEEERIDQAPFLGLNGRAVD